MNGSSGPRSINHRGGYLNRGGKHIFYAIFGNWGIFSLSWGEMVSRYDMIWNESVRRYQQMVSQTKPPSHGKTPWRWESSAAHSWPWTSLNQTNEGEHSILSMFSYKLYIVHYCVCIQQVQRIINLGYESVWWKSDEICEEETSSASGSLLVRINSLKTWRWGDWPLEPSMIPWM